MKYLLAIFFVCPPLWSQDDLGVIAVGEAAVAREKIILPPVGFLAQVTADDKKLANEYYRQVINNFSFYRKFFHLVEVSADYRMTPAVFNSPSYELWEKRAGRYLIHSLLGRTGQILELKVKVFDLASRKNIYSKSTILSKGNHRHIVHIICNEIYYSITKRPSIFGSKIVFVSDLPSARKKVIKELYMMDFDGRNKRRLTWHKGIIVSPAISPDKSQVLYSLIRHDKGKINANLRVLDLRTQKSRLVSAQTGINSGGVFSQDGKSVYLTMSYQGNTEIYQINLASAKIHRITRHRGEDVDPSINGQGDRMVFLSSRPGRAMIYMLDPRGVERAVKRISYTGRFNATPRFNPKGQEVAFSSWVDNRFDIYRVNIDGNNLVRLTRNFGSNESPSYSGDGEFIAFASQRVLSRKVAQQNIYIMDRHGEILGAITKNFGQCTSPRWSR